MHNIERLFPIIELNLETKKATLNEKAKESFKDSIDDIYDFLKRINLKKESEFVYIKNNLYFVNIVKGIKYIYLFFFKIDDKSTLLNILKSSEGKDIKVYPKEILKEFLYKFIALKKRYGGFNLKFLYLKINFTQDLKLKIKEDIIYKIIKNSLKVIRTSDIVGQINENSFGIILTNSSLEGTNIVTEKIIKFINEINVENQKRLVEVYASVAAEILIMKKTDFDEFIKELDENSRFTTSGNNIKLVV